jgi:hypothetical protein
VTILIVRFDNLQEGAMKTFETGRSVVGCRIHAFVAPIILAIVILAGSVVNIIGQCTLPNLLVDGGFETGGIPNTFWNPETSTNFGTPLCDVPSCGTGGGASPPRTGAFWLWFGGIPAAETATLGQTVTFPAAPDFATLRFWMRAGTVSSPFTDVVRVRVDGAIQATYTEPTVAEGAYTLREINLTAFATGASHAILFEYVGPTTGTGSFVIDDVELTRCRPTAANVSISGRVFGTGGSSRSKASVTLTDTHGNSQSVLTNALGYYRFDEVESGRTYTISVASKTAVYAPRLVNVDDDLSEIDFMPME